MALERARAALGQVFNQRCFYLFFGVLTLMMAALFLEPTPRARVLVNTLHILMDVAAVAAVGRSRWSFAIVLVLAAPAAYFHTRAIMNDHPSELLYSWSFGSALYLATLGYLMRYVFQRDVMTADRLYGAAAGFLMLGVLWTFLFAIANFLQPGSFIYLGGTASPTYSDLLYFSFTTLTTTGYGDFIPVSRQVRALCVLEQLTGALFVAILIARLTGVYPPRRRQPE